jgi:hypothetical protein
VRLALGGALDALSASGGHYELGFSSFEAYARERCARTARWSADTRALSRQLASLPRAKAALVSGAIGWSTAELLARHVTADSELAWLERARHATVRELRSQLAQSAANSVDNDLDSEPIRALTVSTTREDTWAFECARKVAQAVAGSTSHDQLLQSLLAEAYSTLLELEPDCAALLEIDALENEATVETQAHAAWCADRKRWRNAAEELCEHRWSAAEYEAGEPTLTPCVPASTRRPEALDREVRRLCTELSERDLALGVVAETARTAEVWRRLGFATEAQYARERLGVSVSSLKAKRVLASRAAKVPELAAALSSGRIGYEAAYLLSRVVTTKTAREWIARAEQRTVKHLREEVDATELLIRMGKSRDQRPLDEASLDVFLELERSIVSGDWVGQDRDSWAGEVPRRETPSAGQVSGAVSQSHGRQHAANAGSQMSGAVSQSGGAGSQMSGAVSQSNGVGSQMSGERLAARLAQRFGRVTLRFPVTERTYRFFRALERVFTRLRARVCRTPLSFLRFLCENFCRLWLPALRQARLTESGKLPEYFSVYRRDAFRCTSPVCTRRDVTPHHLVFRSHGGGDEDENVASLCVWCHLSGVHEGRIAAEPPASTIRWRIGRSATLRVEGRTLLA